MGKNNNKDDTLATSVAEIAGGGVGLKKLLDNGYIDGRTTVYHGTSSDAAKKIMNEGILSKYTANGAKEAASVIGEVDLPKDVVEKSKGHVFLTPDKKEAASYAAQHLPGGGRSVVQDANFAKRYIRNLYGADKGVVKARIPLYARETIRNPEVLDSYSKWKEELGKRSPLLPPERQLRSIYSSLKRAVVVKGDVAPEFIKGDNYKKIGLSEYERFLSKNKSKAALGIVGGLGALSLIGHGAYSAFSKKNKK